MAGRNDVLLFVGPPGSGKGALSQRCVKELDCKQLSTGDLCRWHIAQGTPIGKEIDLAIKSGKLVNDALISDMVTQWFGTLEERVRVILDGYPRTVVQARYFDAFAAQKLDKDAVTVVRLAVEQDIVVGRLGSRIVCSKKECQAVYSADPASPFASRVPGVCDRCGSPLIKRADDRAESIVERLKIYGTHEAQLLAFYEAAGYRLLTLNAGKPAHEVFSEFVGHLGAR